MLSYETLIVYQKAFALSQEIYRFLKKDHTIPPYMRNQLGRSCLSIMLNIAEGTAKIGLKDRRNFYVIARGSLFEASALVKFLATEKEIPIEWAQKLNTSFEEISKMLFTLIKNLSIQK